MINGKLRKPLTKAGHTKLADEHFFLMNKRRPEVVQGIATAAAEGDRSENAEYIYGKKLLREIDKRIRYLNSLLQDAQIIDAAQLSGSMVCFASTVTVEDEDGVCKEYTIVGEGEADSSGSMVSWLSPMGKALLGKEVGAMVTVRRPKGDTDLEIVDLSFGGRHYKA